jgi:hypothetical protein
MFTDEKNSIFEENDDFGVQQYREDIDVLIRMNSVQVKLLNKNPKIIENQQGDFGGATTKIYDDNGELVSLCINSNNSESDVLTEDGYQGRGEIRFNCYMNYNIKLDNKSIIEFITDYSYGIKAGDRFKVEMKETGQWQGQYTYNNFDIIKIS